ncbi:MAG: formate dehydrogenase subunit alpha, partial [Syntrophaceae bacterium]|nr:formate dehydrogenase subunit alpha [Syntrophaceae bacterium]
EIGHPGTRFLHQGRFSRGKGSFCGIEYRPADELPDPAYPFSLTTGRVFAQFHTGTMTRNSPSLKREIDQCFVELHPADAGELGLADGQMAAIESRRGAVRARVRLTDRINRGTVFMPFHFLESRANLLTNPAADPVAKIPEYKVCAVRIQVAAEGL